MNWSGQKSSEKRSFIRMKIDAMLTYTIEGKNEKYEGKCKNISGAGLLIETSKKISVGTKIHLTIPSENPNVENLNATAEVTRVIAYPEKHIYEIGAAIQQIN